MGKWLRLEQDNFIQVLPEKDIRPHGIKLNNRNYVLSVKCACKPKIISGDDLFFYKYPFVIHNSWEQRLKIYKSLKVIFGNNIYG